MTRKITSSEANKLIKTLEDEKSYITTMESKVERYYSTELEKEINAPEYDFKEVHNKIMQIDEQIQKLKHAININNVNTYLPEPHNDITIDQALVKMAQLNKRNIILNAMRKTLPKERSYESSDTEQIYIYTSYNPVDVNKQYEEIRNQVMELQSGIDYCNQTVIFEVDI